MQDDNPTLTPPVTRRRSGGGGPILAALLAFLLGGGAVGALAWNGDLDRILPAHARPDTLADTGNPAPDTRPDVAPPSPAQAVTTLESRLALLEARFSRIDYQAGVASGNAARAEGLLIAYAARRLVDRGEPLGFVGDQLRLRFADAQPQAVETIAAFTRDPVTIDALGARLEALAPDLTDNAQRRNFWQRAREEVAALFRVRSDSPTLLAPGARIERAKLMLAAGRIPQAIDEVGRLPGAEAANKWVADAQRYHEAQRALDLIETTAMLEPRRLKDGAGHPVREESPLAAPTPEAAAEGAVAPPALETGAAE